MNLKFSGNMIKNVFKKRFQKKSFSTVKPEQSPSQFQQQQSFQNKLKLIFLGATTGGAFIGFGMGPYFNKDKCDIDNNNNNDNDQQQQTQQQNSKKNNIFDFKGEWNNNWDGLQSLTDSEAQFKDKVLEQDGKLYQYEAKKRGTRYITVIRHGQYHTEAEEKDQKVLTKLGEKQAALTGERLAKLNVQYDKIYVSGLIRAQQTGKIIQSKLSKKQNKNKVLIQDDGLSEGNPAPIEPPLRSSHVKRNQEFSILEGDGKRISDSFERYFKRCTGEEDSHELYVIHANVIRYFLCRVLQFPVEGWLRQSISHCGISQIEIRPDGTASITNLGDSGHLEKENITRA